MKHCPRCRETKALSEFTRRSGPGREGQVAAYCKRCFSAYMATRRPLTAWVRAPHGFKHCRGCGQVKPADAFGRRTARPSGRVARCRRCISSAAEYRQIASTEGGRLRIRQYASARRARIRSVTVGRVDYAAIYARDGGRCWICWLTVPLASVHFDHVEPLARGGEHSMENIRTACQPCNDRKRDFEPTPALIARIGEEVRRLAA